MRWLELIGTPSDGIFHRSDVYYVNKAKQSVENSEKIFASNSIHSGR